MAKDKKENLEVKAKDLLLKTCDVSQEIDFLSRVFSDPMALELDESQFVGLSKILQHINKDLYQMLDVLEPLT